MKNIRPNSANKKIVGTLQIALVAIAAGGLAASQLVYGQSPDNAISQTPLFVSQALPPLNMLVMGRDQKLYFEAYNDASDLDNDGAPDVGYKPGKISYYGNFNNSVCYTYEDGVFVPKEAAGGTSKIECKAKWSGDFLNYLTTSRMDAIRRVLYGGSRIEDTTTKTVLAGSYIPRDAHTWGKAYDPNRDSYDIAKYAPLSKPALNTRHLFAVTTLGEAKGTIPVLRVLNDSQWQIWNWVSIEGMAGQDNCWNGAACAKPASKYTLLGSNWYKDLTITTWKWSNPSSSQSIPNNLTSMDQFFTDNAKDANLCGTASISEINVTGGDNNPFSGVNGCKGDYYLTKIQGKIFIPSNDANAGYKFSIDGDDAVDVKIGSDQWGWYNGHANNRDNYENPASRVSSATFPSGAGWKDIEFRHLDATGGDNWGLAVQTPAPASNIVNYNVKVEVCPSGDANASLRDATCKPYTSASNTVYKPTGLLHDFGENDKMYFGLLTGSYQNNIKGGVLRSNVKSFKEEINSQTGQFRSDVVGIVANIDRQRVIGYELPPSTPDKPATQPYYLACGWNGTASLSELPNPENCAMWGNPIAEMMFETMRYFSGATDGHSYYRYKKKDDTADTSLDAKEPLGLSAPEWKPPYEPVTAGGGGFLRCSKPAMTVLSDINPSYDYKLPGSPYSNKKGGGSVSAEVAALDGFNVANEVKAIGVAENITGKDYFIGQTSLTNGNLMPTVKHIDDFSLVRGLSPQEPSKQGTYYSAGVARFAANNALFGPADGKNKLMTYSVAIASPLPEIRFPVKNGQFVTIAPFAKSININSYKPTNQIVDFYIDRIANTGAGNVDLAVNEGRPYAEFRINYEDMEQGADFDMDAIGRYIIKLNKDGRVQIDMVSEYASGSYIQPMGYVISGTEQDGPYLEIRDKDTAEDKFIFYEYNTPPNRAPGFCIGKDANPSSDDYKECKNLGLRATRYFTPSSNATVANFLKDPLWYAAKYGIPGRDTSTISGDPDNYFLVTNAATLKDQLTKAFNDIMQNNSSVAGVSVDIPSSKVADGATIYRTKFEAEHWSGDLIRESINKAGAITEVWSAAKILSTRLPSSRSIYFASPGTPGNPASLKPFTIAEVSNASAWLSALNKDPVTHLADTKAADRINSLRGEVVAGLRDRALIDGHPNVLGDIVNSSLVRVKDALYRATAADAVEGITGGTNSYKQFAQTMASQAEMLYVGGNDGMLHAFDTDGNEVFAFVPTGVKDTIGDLTTAGYGTSSGVKPHRYYVDATPQVSDVFFDGKWHRVLVSALGAGGNEVFALDITDPAHPKLLWEFGLDVGSKMGVSLAQPTIARLNDVSATSKGKWVALIPNGYQGPDSAAGKASLSVVDIADGSLIKRFDVDGSLTAAELTALAPVGNGLSRVAAVDNNTDGKIDIAYAGDLAGNVWRFDLSDGSSTAWTAKLLYTATQTKTVSGATVTSRQPITAAPYVVKHPTSKGDLVIFGTGRYLTGTDRASNAVETVYGIWDRYSDIGAIAPASLPTANKGRSNLQDQAFTALGTNSGNFSLSDTVITWYKTGVTTTTDADVNKWGWYVDMPRSGEKLVYDFTLYGRGLVFNSTRPANDPCSAGMYSTIYAIDPYSGGKTDYVVFDINHDGKFDDGDKYTGAYVNGTETNPGQLIIRDGQVFTPGGSHDLKINSGVDLGRQSWRRQPKN